MSVLQAEEQAEFDSCRNRRMLGGMLHFILSILLGILKIIGILLPAVLVLLLLLVLSAILFARFVIIFGSKKTEEALEEWQNFVAACPYGRGFQQTDGEGHTCWISEFSVFHLTKLRERLRRRKQKKKQQKQDTKNRLQMK